MQLAAGHAQGEAVGRSPLGRATADSAQADSLMEDALALGELSGVLDLAVRFHAGQTFDAMLASAAEHAELYRSLRSRAIVPPEYPARIAATGRQWHLLVISEDWCGDSANILPWVAALADDTPALDMHIISRDRNPDLMDRHLTNGSARAIPIVLLLDDRFVERAWWGPRPLALQEWFMTPEAQAMSKDERYRALRVRYSRDRGRGIMEELTRLVEQAAAQDKSDDSAMLRAAS